MSKFNDRIHRWKQGGRDLFQRWYHEALSRLRFR